MENNTSALTPQKINSLSSTQCTTHFLKQLDEPFDTSLSWQTLFPIASEMIKNFVQLPQPLLFLNAQYWHTAKNLLINCNQNNLPLLTLQSYDQETLFGRVNLTTDSDITYQPGQIENLNAGLLVLHISPLLMNPTLWFLLKAFLLNQDIPVNAAVNGNKLRGLTTKLNTEKVTTKIILVANRYQLDELTQIDPDFSQVSSHFAEVAADIKKTAQNIQAIYQCSQEIIEANEFPSISIKAFAELLTHFSRLSEHQNNIRFSPELIKIILGYAKLLLSQDTCKSNDIEIEHVLKALELKQKAQSNAQNFSDQAILEKQIKIQLKGESIGQINGLSVVELMGYPTEFGEVFRISASDMVGDGEIIDVERKVELAGNIHAKSTLIVQGYLNHFFTHIANFPLSCNVVFEQSYQESDGDSASLAILLAVSSCYAETPIAQNLFVTGALDQQGNVLPIGGINQKIEAITRLFSLGLLSEPVTVLMPQANKVNLILNKKTLQLIDEKKINIYPIQHCLEAFPFAMSHSFESVIKIINKRIHFLHKEEEDEPISLLTKCLNLLR